MRRLLFGTYPSVLNIEMSSFRGWGGFPLYTSFQGVRIEDFLCIQRYPHFRVLE